MALHTRRRSTSSSSSSVTVPSRPTLSFLPLEQHTEIPSYPSFSQRLTASDTWSGTQKHLHGAPASPNASSTSSHRAHSSSPHITRSWFSSCSSPPSVCSSRPSSTRFSVSPTSTRSRDPASSRRPRRKNPTSPKSSPSASTTSSACAAAVRSALQTGELDALTYTEGQLQAVMKRGAKTAQPPEERPLQQEGGESRSNKRKRTSGYGGIEGQVKSAVKTRRIEFPRFEFDGEVKQESEDEDEEADVVTKVEVDMSKLLGM